MFALSYMLAVKRHCWKRPMSVFDDHAALARSFPLE